ncbi:hypothetical protein TNCV_1383991 [Trichonephila clavipes]|nr:hypothetical protein TNCV_1383991 [Trichonephila clavipes]
MGGRRSPKLQRQFVHLPCLQETDLKKEFRGCLRSTDSMAGEAVSLHSLLANQSARTLKRMIFRVVRSTYGLARVLVFYSFFVCQKTLHSRERIATRGQPHPSKAK